MKGGKDVTGTILGEGLPVSQKKTCKGPNSILARKSSLVASGSRRTMGKSEAVREETKPRACFPEKSFDW